MFERYTDRTRRAVELAQEEAADLGHDAVGTDHLLLGLLGEGGGVAFRALDALGVTEAAANAAVCQRHPAGTRRAEGHIPLTPGLKKAMEFALRESVEHGHNYIGTEHLLLGLIREGSDTGALALADCGIAEGDRGFLADVRAKVLELLRGYAESEQAPAARPGELLTAAERDAVRLAGELYTHIAGRVVGDGPTREGDLAEIRQAVHVVQRSVMAQAAARAFPGEFRLLGGTCGD